MAKPKISAKAIVSDLKRGLPDSDLMARYGVSERGLQSLFQKLLNAGLVDREIIEGRDSSACGTSKPPSPREISPTDKGVTSQSDLDKRHSAHSEHDGVREFPPPSQQGPEKAFVGKLKDGTWKEDKILLILFLLFLSPVGLYGLARTSLFKRITKILVGVFTALLVILLLWTGIPIFLWIVSGFVIGLCALWSYLRRRKRADVPAPALGVARTDRPTEKPVDRKVSKRQESGGLRNLLGSLDWQRGIGIPACLILGVGVFAPFFGNSAPGWGYKQTLLEFSPLSGWGILACVLVSFVILLFRKYSWLWFPGPIAAAFTGFSVWLFFEVKASKGASVAWLTGKAGFLAGTALAILSKKKEALNAARAAGERGGEWLGGWGFRQTYYPSMGLETACSRCSLAHTHCAHLNCYYCCQEAKSLILLRGCPWLRRGNCPAKQLWLILEQGFPILILLISMAFPKKDFRAYLRSFLMPDW